MDQQRMTPQQCDQLWLTVQDDVHEHFLAVRPKLLDFEAKLVVIRLFEAWEQAADEAEALAILDERMRRFTKFRRGFKGRWQQQLQHRKEPTNGRLLHNVLVQPRRR